MTSPRLARAVKDLEKLTQHLSRCKEVIRFGANEPDTLAHAFVDLEESFRRFLEDDLPRLKSGRLNSAETYDLLLEIGEELRHVLYHIKDPAFYRYLDDRSGD